MRTKRRFTDRVPPCKATLVSRRVVVAAIASLLAACEGETSYVGLTFEVLTPEGFEWSRVASIAVDLDDGEEVVRAEAAVEDGAFELVIEPSDPQRLIIARVTLRDPAGGDVAAGATPPFVPLEIGVSSLRVFVSPHGSMTPLPGILPEARHGGAATSLLGQYALVVSGPGDGSEAALYDGLTHAFLTGLAMPSQPIVRPRLAEIAPGLVLVLGDDTRAQLYDAVLGNAWGDAWSETAELDAAHLGATPGACVAALPEGGALVVGGRGSDGTESGAVTLLGLDGGAQMRPPLAEGRDGCRLVAFGSAVLVLPAVPEAGPYPDDLPPLLYDVSTGETAVLTGAGAETTAAARLIDGSALLVHRDGGLYRLEPRASGDVTVGASDYRRVGLLDSLRIAPDVLVVGSLGVLVVGGSDADGVALDGGQSFGVDVSPAGSLEDVPRRGSAIASLPDVGVLVFGGSDAPNRVMLLRP
ncbi:MAG: hypothetical protein IT379_29450 [Deltaproteobacteria bacterium]|nr:hypothetical protein [Deltaproteobacteria bacterium]